jgi:polysaccharide chain length determinant protein (PEP-CTERM system associated)
MNLDQGTQVIDLLGLTRRRGKLIAMIAGAVILLTFWVSMALPNLYTSAAMILVEPQSIDEELVNSGVSQIDLGERLGLMSAEILSRSRLSGIIDEFGLYEDESESLQRSEVIELMRSYISVEPVLSELEQGARNRNPNFSTFRIVFRHENKFVAAKVAQEIANDFIDANIKSRTEITRKSLDFMRDEIESLSGELATVEKAIADVKAENAGSLPEEFDSNQRMLQFAMNDLRGAERLLAAAESDASYWKAQALAASTLSGGGDQNSPQYRLQALELQRGSLLAKGFTQRHPDIVQVDAEIALLRRQLQAAGQGEDIPKSIGEQNALSEQNRAELRAQAAAEDIERLRDRVASIEDRIARTASVAELLDALDRRYENLSRSYQDFSSRLQQASVQAQLERRQLGEKFRILEAAEPAVEPSSPNRILILVLGAILGLAFGAGTGLVSEVTDSSMHTSAELQKTLGIPVLISVPKIMLESDRVARSRRIFRESLAAAGVVLFVLIGGATTYYLVNVRGGSSEAAEEMDGEESSSSAMTVDRVAVARLG